MTITEFLLARIAEDEAVYHPHYLKAETHEELARAEAKLVDGAGDVVFAGGDGLLRAYDVLPRRTLAECEAKRRIVDALIDMEPVESERRDQVVTLRWSCMALALPYADHPDYDQTWTQ